jgi:tetratricopeptide (TPR) repeat protein
MQEAETAASAVARRADFTEADLEGLERALDLPSSATVVASLLEGLSARGAASLPSLQRLAVAYERTGRPADARKTLERVAALDPANTAHLLELARLADAAKDYEGALGYLARARDLAPDNARIHYLFAITAMELDLPIEARRSLERALQLDPDNPAYNYAMGSVILTTRDAATASSYLEKFVKAKPADAKGHYALGAAYFASGDYERAKREMQGLKNDPAVGGAANFFLGRMANIEGDLDAAKNFLRVSIQRLTSFAESHTELARVYMSEKNLDAAKTELAEALRLDPKSFRANTDLLALYRRTHDSRADRQAELVKKLDEDRSRRAELMLRTIEVRP